MAPFRPRDGEMHPSLRTDYFGKVYWQVRPLILVGLTSDGEMLISRVRFYDGCGDTDPDIIERDVMAIEEDESGLFEVPYREYSGALYVYRFDEPTEAMQVVAVRTVQLCHKWIHDYYKRICGWRRTNKVTIRFQYKYPADCL